MPNYPGAKDVADLHRGGFELRAWIATILAGLRQREDHTFVAQPATSAISQRTALPGLWRNDGEEEASWSEQALALGRTLAQIDAECHTGVETHASRAISGAGRKPDAKEVRQGVVPTGPPFFDTAAEPQMDVNGGQPLP
jgi:hypothetical protein